MNEKIIGENIYLAKIDYGTWSGARELRYSEGFTKYDPCMPVQSEEQEKAFYDEFVKTNRCIIFAIYNNAEQLIGFIQAFDFMKLNSLKKEEFKYYQKGSECETGIWILSEDNFGKGYGYQSYNLLLNYLKKEYNLKKTIVFTYTGNPHSTGLYKKLGYQESDIFKFEGYEYKKFELTL